MISNKLAALPRALQVLCRFYPLYSGRAKIAHSFVLRRALLHEELEARVTLASGTKIIVPTDDHVGRTIYYFGDYDRKISWVCQRVLRTGDVFIDIGAHLGLLSLIAAPLVGPEGVVHAFEPQPNLAAYFRRSVHDNGYDHVHIHMVALGDHDGNCSLFVPHDNSGCASFTRMPATPGTAFSVPVRRASNYLDNCDVKIIRLLKIDVEGYEGNVLRGAYEFICSQPPQAILFEINDEIPFQQQASVQILKDMGYAFFEIRRSLIRMNVYQISKANVKDHYWQDILAVHRSSNFDEIVARVTR